MSRLVKAFKQIKLKDLIAPFVFIGLLIPSLCFRLINIIRRRKLWLVAEEGGARDNAYHFFKYIRDTHPNDYCFYAVDSSSEGYDKIKKLGNHIEFGSLKHWLYYMSADLNISNQKSGNPCPIFWYFIHVKLGLYKNRAYLQHGLVKDDLDWLYYSKTKFIFYSSGAKREHDYIAKTFGYPKGVVVYTGLARFDNLYINHSDKKDIRILLMPSWRSWLGADNNALNKTTNFQNTDFYKYWNSLLSDKKLINFIEEKNITVLFYPHQNMQKFLSYFKPKSANIKIVDMRTDIQEAMKQSDLLITDWSSVFFDFAYMLKPIIFYQFDQEEYRKRQYVEGYFSYEKDGFGDIIYEKDEIIEKIISYYKSNFKPEKNYLLRMKEFFAIHDNKNCERIYDALTTTKHYKKVR